MFYRADYWELESPKQGNLKQFVTQNLSFKHFRLELRSVEQREWDLDIAGF